MIVAVCSIRGAPGATSWALLLAAAWPLEQAVERVMLEADPAGGVVGARYGLGVEPGAIQFVTAVRRGTSEPVSIEGVSRLVADGVAVIPGPETGERARAVWSESAPELSSRLAQDDRTWIVDLGRSDESNPSVAFVEHAAAVVLVVGPRPEDLVQLPSRIARLRRATARVVVVVSGRCEFVSADVAEFSGADGVWVVDPRGDLVEEVGSVLGGRRGRRSWLWRQALEVGASVAELASLTQASTAPLRVRGER